jgi:hypothetical protein
MDNPNEDELRRSVRKYIARRQRAVTRGQASPNFPRDRSLIFHIVPDTFDPTRLKASFEASVLPI